MSTRPRPCWPGIPSVMSRARRIMPAHVASVASPARIASRTGWSIPARSSSIAIVVLSPPGSTMPSNPSRSSVVRTSLVRAPAASSALTCSAKAPCIARTPISGAAAWLGRAELPASGSEQLVLGDGRYLQAVHGLTQLGGDLGQDLGLVEVGGRRNDRLGTLQGVLRLEDAGPDKDTIHPQLHHQRGVGGRRDAAGGEVDNRKAAQLLTFDQHLDRRADLLCLVHQLGVVHALQLADAGVDGARVADGLHDIPCARLALRPDHGRAFRDAAGRLAEVAAAADKRDLERVLVDVIFLVGRGENFGLVDVVDAESLQDLRLDEVADPALGHDRDRDHGHDRLDQLGVRHAGYAAFLADVSRDALQRHDRAGARLLGDACVLGRDDVHDHAAFEHLGQAGLDLEAPLYPFVSIARTVAFGHDRNCTRPLRRLRPHLPMEREEFFKAYSLSSTSVRFEAYSVSESRPSRCSRVSMSISSSTSSSGAIVRRARYASEAVPASSPRASNSRTKKSALTAEKGIPSFRTGLSLCSACRCSTTPYRWRSRVPSRWPRSTSPSRKRIATLRVGVSASSLSRCSSTHFTAVSGIHAVSLFSRPPASSTSTRKSGSSKSRSRATPSTVSSSKKRTTIRAISHLLY